MKAPGFVAAGEAGIGRETPRIALFEDEYLIALEMQHRLRRLGAEVVGHWRDVDTGLRELPARAADVVLMDIRLAGAASGLEAAATIRAEWSLPVVMLTAHGDDITIAAARAAGAFGFLVKPPEEVTLLATLSMALENGRLLRALVSRQRELERSNRDLAAVAAIAAHDIRTPVGQAVSLLDMLELDGPLTPAQAEGVTDARGSLMRSLHMVEGVLALARLETAQVASGVLDLRDPLRQALRDTQAAARDADVDVHMAEALPVAGDETQLHRLFLNLLVNALKFRAPARAHRVVLHGERVGDEAVVVIEDNGIGFDTDEASTLFRPLTRLASASAYDGSGMGLATCSRIVARHGGSIRATGRREVGARFDIRLPLV